MRRLAIGLVALPACTFEIEPWYHIDSTRAFGARMEVVELGPAWPIRVGLASDTRPITEPLPGDRVRFELIIVDEHGQPQPAEDFDALWFQCGVEGCIRSYAALDERVNTDEASACAAIEWTSDSTCRLGRGGAIEFEYPAIGQAMMDVRVGRYYAVVALDDEHTAEGCLAARVQRDHELDGCAYIERELKIGPSWAMLLDGVLAGLTSTIPVFEIPAPAFAQPSNRLPNLDGVIMSGDQFDQYGGIGVIVGLEDPPIQVRPGEELIIQQVLTGLDAAQTYFAATEIAEGGAFVFQPGFETLYFEWYTTDWLVRLPDPLGSADAVVFTGGARIRVHEEAEPGPSRLVLLYGDDRGSQAMTWIDFEVIR